MIGISLKKKNFILVLWNKNLKYHICSTLNEQPITLLLLTSGPSNLIVFTFLFIFVQYYNIIYYKYIILLIYWINLFR